MRSSERPSRSRGAIISRERLPRRNGMPSWRWENAPLGIKPAFVLMDDQWEVIGRPVFVLGFRYVDLYRDARE